MKTFEEVREIIKTCWMLDVDVLWMPDSDDGVKCNLSCSDLFFWACADCEEIRAADLPLLRSAYLDLEKALSVYLDLEKASQGAVACAGELFCCRKRRMRPQGAYYKYLPKEAWGLFNACGPHREASFGNPVETPA